MQIILELKELQFLYLQVQQWVLRIDQLRDQAVSQSQVKINFQLLDHLYESGEACTELPRLFFQEAQ